MKKIFPCIILLLLLGCATAYQPMGFSGGYDDTRLDQNVFRVVFSGNGYTSRQRAIDLCLLRCAELTLRSNYRYFVIVDSNSYSSVSSYTTPQTTRTTASVNTYGNYSYGTAKSKTTGGQTYYFSKPSADNVIVCFQEKPELSGAVYNAKYVYDSIAGKYRIKK